MKRARKAENKLKTWLGRMIRDIERKLGKEAELIPYFEESLQKANQIYHQQKEDSNKIYSWHAPEMECIRKGKAHKPYEFGCKVSITTNVNSALAEHFVLHAKALHGNPYNGHTLNEILSEMNVQTGIENERNYVDKGYRGHKHPKKHRVGLTATIQ